MGTSDCLIDYKYKYLTKQQTKLATDLGVQRRAARVNDSEVLELRGDEGVLSLHGYIDNQA